MADRNKAQRASLFLTRKLSRQIIAFGGAGVAATAVHYATLVGLVQLGDVPPVPAALGGYTTGGLVSYLLNRRHTYQSDRPHHQAAWRFAVVAGVGFFVTWLFMYVLVNRCGLPYLPAQVLTTGSLLVWSFSAHKWWTFREQG